MENKQDVYVPPYIWRIAQGLEHGYVDFLAGYIEYQFRGIMPDWIHGEAKASLEACNYAEYSVKNAQELSEE